MQNKEIIHRVISKPKTVGEGGLAEGFLEEVINWFLKDMWPVQIEEPINMSKNGGKKYTKYMGLEDGVVASSFMPLEQKFEAGSSHIGD